MEGESDQIKFVEAEAKGQGCGSRCRGRRRCGRELWAWQAEEQWPDERLGEDEKLGKDKKLDKKLSKDEKVNKHENLGEDDDLGEKPNCEEIGLTFPL